MAGGPDRRSHRRITPDWIDGLVGHAAGFLVSWTGPMTVRGAQPTVKRTTAGCLTEQPSHDHRSETIPSSGWSSGHAGHTAIAVEAATLSPPTAFGPLSQVA